MAGKITRPWTMWSATRLWSAPAAGERKTSAPSEDGSRRWARECVGSSHKKARCWYATLGIGSKAAAIAILSPSTARTTAVAMTPLTPNAATPQTSMPFIPRPLVGSATGSAACRMGCATSGLRARSCAFVPNCSCCNACWATSRPIRPEGASLWPALALWQPIANADSRFVPSTVMTARISIGSASAEPSP